MEISFLDRGHWLEMEELLRGSSTLSRSQKKRRKPVEKTNGESKLAGGFTYFLYFHPYLGKMNPF